jgi:hypothetical protein
MPTIGIYTMKVKLKDLAQMCPAALPIADYQVHNGRF